MEENWSVGGDSRNASSNLSRRSALKSVGTGVVGCTGLWALSGTAAAAEDEWENEDTASSSDTVHAIGAGLRLKNEAWVDDGDYKTVWEVSGDGVLNSKGNDGEKWFPTRDDWYDEVPDEIDICAGNGGKRDRADLYSDAIYSQGIVLKVPSEMSVDADFKDNDEKYMFPEQCGETNEDAGRVFVEAAKIAASKNPIADGLIAGAELGNAVLKFFDEESGTTYDLRGYYSEGFFRGGYGLTELKITADSGEYGTVDLSMEFGWASTGFEIYIENDGMYGDIEVTKK